jgi:lipid-A-disaccharide synthase
MKYFIIAGEASGDLHASNLMKSIKNKDADANFCFLGGDKMLNVGGEIICHYRDMAFMGFLAVILHLPKVIDNLKRCKSAICNFRPDVVILVDYPSFNLKIAQFVKKNFNIPVCYYISPKLWAWKTYRIKAIKKYIDKMLCILPFESEFYSKFNYDAHYVGNPTAETINNYDYQSADFESFTKSNNLPSKPILAILAGSRQQEIAACLLRMISAAEHFNDYQPVVAGAPGIDRAFYSKILNGKNIAVVYDQTYELVRYSTAAIVNSGTATLETALIGTPQVVVYHVAFGRLAFVAKQLFIKVKYVSLVNLIAEKTVVPELIAHLFSEKNIVAELEKILYSTEYENVMRNEYAAIKTKLGKSQAAEQAAEEIVDLLRRNASQTNAVKL